ncbi:hypothetical protein [Pseudobacteriovorax antillogorgiicola]|uniref:Helix-turn-helix domain-containing protein n=1 Tax=Pseudobacteriovorax antillogorgiicola TaxID=1513793 RepID=A0A1Y6B8M6_9BACT|nr:hypothetical protein [Pseudobacteriovorax antillogorgiicola]TCS59246.1 hypothetical protein EDD56_101149 [Pseudobacteriovorax antillogorgiicola]SME90113.1 hypothetical protein SAMN06296036_101337 [Pseudobacteriovorax antillogorgiicola]
MAEQWMSIVEYARTFSISDMTVRRRIKNGKLNAVLRDGKYFIQVDSPNVAKQMSAPTLDTFTSPPSNTPDIAPSANRSNSVPRQPMLHHEKGGAVNAGNWSKPENLIKSRHEDLDHMLDRTDQDPHMKAMLDYCERSINRINSIERHLAESYQHKFARLESENKRKDMEIAQLKQQVEDLQILIKMYDRESKT